MIDLIQLWITIGAVGWALYSGFNKTGRSAHHKLDETNSEIIIAYERRIRQLEENHKENQHRITQLEKSMKEQTIVMNKQREYIEGLVELVQGRDPEIQEA